MSIPLTVKVSGNFLSRLQQRIAAFSAAKVSATLVAPPELQWWAWNEYGTAAHTISAINAPELRFPYEGVIAHALSVQNPGIIKPGRSVTKALPAIREQAIEKVREAFSAGGADDPSILHEAIVNAVEAAKTLIVESMAENIPGRRALEPEQGRLGGQTAAEVFQAETTVE